MTTPLKRTRIAIKRKYGFDPVRVLAVIVGPFGVHKDDLDSSRYSVTHVPSGYSAGQGLWLTKAKAVRFARQLAKCTLINWHFTDPRTVHPRIWKKVSRVREQLLNDVMVKGKRSA